METSIIDYTCNVEELKGVSRQKVAATLADVGFTVEGQAAPIASLSGGWKMKLALARAMLQEAQVHALIMKMSPHVGDNWTVPVRQRSQVHDIARGKIEPLSHSVHLPMKCPNLS